LLQDYLAPTPPPPAIREAMAKAAERKEKGLPVYDFSSGNVGALPLKLKLFRTMQIEAEEGVPEGLRLIAESVAKGLVECLYEKPSGFAYSPTGGTTPIKQSVLRYFREIHGLPLTDDDLDRILVTAGGQQAMAVSLRALKPGTEVLMLRWDYSPIPGILKDHGLKETRVRLTEELALDVSDLESKLGQNQVFYLSMPNNPTGYTSVEDLETIARLMEEHNGGVIWDAPYLFTIIRLTENKAVFDRSFLNEIHEKFRNVGRRHYENMCILSSLSKTCLIAGLRVGMATASKQWIANMNAILGRENLSSPTVSFTIAKHLLDAFLERPITHEWTCEVLASRLTVLMEEIGDHLILPRNGVFGALYALVKTPEDGASFSRKLVEEKGIVTVPGNAFYGGPVNAVRLSLVATPWTEGDEVWVDSVRALKAALT